MATPIHRPVGVVTVAHTTLMAGKGGVRNLNGIAYARTNRLRNTQLVTKLIQEALFTLKVGNRQWVFGQPLSVEADSNPVT